MLREPRYTDGNTSDFGLDLGLVNSEREFRLRPPPVKQLTKKSKFKSPSVLPSDADDEEEDDTYVPVGPTDHPLTPRAKRPRHARPQDELADVNPSQQTHSDNAVSSPVHPQSDIEMAGLSEHQDFHPSDRDAVGETDPDILIAEVVTSNTQVVTSRKTKTSKF